MRVLLSNTQMELTKSKEPITSSSFKVFNTTYSILAVVSKNNSNLYNITVKNVNKNKPISKLVNVGKSVVNKRVAELKYTTYMNHRVDRSIELDNERNRKLKKVSKKGRKVSRKTK